MEESQGPSKGQRMDADHPIERRDQDLLGRRSFAEAIARDLSTLPADKGFTAAIVGEWGSGKTSVLNMVAETIEKETGAAVVLRFNPWLFGSAHDLLARFFNELSAQLGGNRAQGAEDVSVALLKLGEIATPMTSLPGSSLVGKGLGLLGSLLGRPQSLFSQRNKLRDVLKKARLRIIVVIDDIDRLDRVETRELIRLVRLTSDLPNLIFLLAFDWLQVAKSLGESSNDDGSQYLDKIIQVKYNIPALRRAALHSLFTSSVDEMLRQHVTAPLDRNIWWRVFNEVVDPLLIGVRDVKRLLYALPLTLRAVGREVSLADLIGIEAVRVLKPEMFNLLMSNTRVLVREHSFSRPLIDDEERKNALVKLLDQGKASEALLKSVLEVLFPATQGYLGGMSWGPSFDRVWRRERRLGCEEVLRIYLHAGIEEGELQYGELEELLAKLTDKEALEEHLDSLDDTQFQDALDRLQDYERMFPIESVPVAVPVLANRMGRLSPRSAGLVGFSHRTRAYSVIYGILSSVADEEVLNENLAKALESVESLSGRIKIVGMVGHRGSIGLRLLNEKHANDLEQELIGKLEIAGTTQLSTEWSLFEVVYLCTQWAGESDRERLIAILNEHIDDDKFVLKLLLTGRGEQTTNSHVESTLPWETLVGILGEKLGDRVEELAKAPLYQELTEEERSVVDLAQRYSQGLIPPSILDI